MFVVKPHTCGTETVIDERAFYLYVLVTMNVSRVFFGGEGVCFVLFFTLACISFDE